MSINALKHNSHIINEDGNEVYLSQAGGEYILNIETLSEKKELGYKLKLSKENYDHLSSLLESTGEDNEEPTEIERKFLLKRLPKNLESYKKTDIAQGYVIITASGTELRVRNKGGKYTLTIKKGKGKTRVEGEIKINETDFNSLWGMTDGRTLEKTRYEIPYKCLIEGRETELLIELDIYRGKLKGLRVAEVEFKNEKDSNLFIKPKDFSEEVTEDKKFKNQNLAIIGKEQIDELKKEVSEKVRALLKR